MWDGDNNTDSYNNSVRYRYCMLLFDIEYDDHFQEKGCIGLNHTILYSVHSVVWGVDDIMVW